MANHGLHVNPVLFLAPTSFGHLDVWRDAPFLGESRFGAISDIVGDLKVLG